MKCPPGILCLTPSLVIVLGIIVAAIAAVAVVRTQKQNDTNEVIEKIVYQEPIQERVLEPVHVTIVPPLQNQVPPSPERLYDTGNLVRTEIPMTIATSGGPSPYQQVGVMRKDGEEEDMLLPLFGRKLQANRDKWNYYTSGVAGTLPVRVQNRDCMDRYTGCNELYDGDTVTVDGLNNGVFKVMMYTVSAPWY